ncbi:MAG: CPBP family intramembrane glutamic endopeptidase, partial [Pseudomonadota bacterium]
MIQQPQSLFPALRRRTPLFEPAYRAWVGAGRKRPQIWRLIPGLLLIFGCWALTSFLSLYLGGLWALAGSGVEDVDPVEAFFSMPSRASGLFVLSSFSGIWIGVWLALRLCHRRSFTPLLAARGHWRTAELFLGLVIALGFASFVMVLNGLSGAEVPFKVSSLTDWGLLLVPLLALVVVQAGGEELIFRGYLQQQLAARSRNPLIWLVLPSILFWLLHPIGIGYVFSTFLFAMAAG